MPRLHHEPGGHAVHSSWLRSLLCATGVKARRHVERADEIRNRVDSHINIQRLLLLLLLLMMMIPYLWLHRS